MESGTQGERKRRESNKERTRENDKNGIREEPEERKGVRTTTETIKTKPAGSRETGEEGLGAIWE